MMLQLQAYKIPVVYKKGKYMYLADRLSSAVFNLSAPSGPQEEMFQCDPEDPPEMFRVHLKTLELDLSDVYPNTMKETKVATKADPILKKVYSSWLAPLLCYLLPYE